MHATITLTPLASASAPTTATMPRSTTSRTEATVGDSDFASLYRREYPAMIAVATALSGPDGEDLVHDAMVKAFLHWRTVQHLERPGGWCHRVLVNLCRSWWRRRRTRQRHMERQRRVEPSTAGPSVEALAFWAAVRTLPERPRSVVTLYYAGDHPVAEISRILDVPEGTVRSDLTRARAALARELEVGDV